MLQDREQGGRRLENGGLIKASVFHRDTDTSVGAGLRYNSGFYEQSGDVRWDQGSFTTVSAQSGYRYNKHIEGTLTVDTLFDRVYYEKLGGAPRQNYCGQPRRVMLNLRYQY